MPGFPHTVVGASSEQMKVISCKLCKMVVKTPVICKKNKTHLFCAECLGNGEKCEENDCDGVLDRNHLKLRELMQTLEFECVYCTWQGSPDKLTEHISESKCKRFMQMAQRIDELTSQLQHQGNYLQTVPIMMNRFQETQSSMSRKFSALNDSVNHLHHSQLKLATGHNNLIHKMRKRQKRAVPDQSPEEIL